MKRTATAFGTCWALIDADPIDSCWEALGLEVPELPSQLPFSPEGIEVRFVDSRRGQIVAVSRLQASLVRAQTVTFEALVTTLVQGGVNAQIYDSRGKLIWEDWDTFHSTSLHPGDTLTYHLTLT